MALNSVSAPNAEAIRAQVERIVSSQIFAAAQRSQAFLRYVVQKSLSDETPKEYEIAIDVFERSPDYDPAVDATVRVEASRLRGRLRDYYGSEGATQPIVIEIPRGGYAARFTERPAVQAPAPIADTLASTPPVQPRHAWRWVALSACLAALAIGAWAAMRWMHTRAPIRSLAVLPLANLSGDPGQQYFADGMTDELTTDLAQIHGLRVVSRASSIIAARSGKTVPQLAEALHVDAVVEGSVVRSGNRVRITAQLIDARTDKHLWAQSFEGPSSDVLSLQDTVAREIAAQAQVVLESNSGGAPRSVDPEAHDAYLRGRYFIQRQQFQLSESYFRQAINDDPAYSSAYAGLASALDAESTIQIVAPSVALPQALAAAQHAIALDASNGEAYTALGSVQTLWVWNWTEAGKNLARGIALNPNDSLGEMKYAVYLDAMGQTDLAVEHLRKAVDLDPMSFLMTRRLGAALILDRHYDQALQYLHLAAEMEPNQPGAFDSYISNAEELSGNQSSAVEDDLRFLHSIMPTVDTGRLGDTYHRQGWLAYWRARRAALEPYSNQPCMMYLFAVNDIRIDERDKAFAELNRAVDQKCYKVIWLKVDPLLDPIRLDPRYKLLVQRLNLPH